MVSCDPTKASCVGFHLFGEIEDIYFCFITLLSCLSSYSWKKFTESRHHFKMVLNLLHSFLLIFLVYKFFDPFPKSLYMTRKTKNLCAVSPTLFSSIYLLDFRHLKSHFKFPIKAFGYCLLSSWPLDNSSMECSIFTRRRI